MMAWAAAGLYEAVGFVARSGLESWEGSGPQPLLEEFSRFATEEVAAALRVAMQFDPRPQGWRVVQCVQLLIEPSMRLSRMCFRPAMNTMMMGTVTRNEPASSVPYSVL